MRLPALLALLLLSAPWRLGASLTLYDGGSPVREYATDLATNPVVRTLGAEYVRGSDWGGGVGGIIYSLPGDGNTSHAKYYHYDGRGDVVAQLAANGTIAYQAAYDAYGTHAGNVSAGTQQAGSDADPFRANTKEEDIFTGFINDGLRYRDPETGVFLTRDPAGFIDGPNLYAYVRQNPWTKFDPEGLWADSYNDWDRASYDAAAQGGAWGWTKSVGIQLARNTLQTLSLGTFSKNSHIAGEVAAGRLSPEDGQIAVAGNALVGTVSIAAGGGAGAAIKAGGGGLIAIGAGAGAAQATTQVVGQHAVAAATGTPHTTVGEDVTQIAATTGLGAAAGAIGEAAVANGLAKIPPSAPSASAGLGSGNPKPSPNFQTPTNAAQLPPTDIPNGWRVRTMPATKQYADGYWRLEKPMANGGWQGIDPSTMKPGQQQSNTHVPFPPSQTSSNSAAAAAAAAATQANRDENQ